MNLIYCTEWSHYRLHSKLNHVQRLLTTFPTDLFQLSFWCEAMIFARVTHLDVPQTAVFYMCDQIQTNIIAHIGQADAIKINFKLNLLSLIYEIKTNEMIVRNLEQAIMAACAMLSFEISEASQIKIKAIYDYLKKQGQFLNQECIKKLSVYLSQKIHPKKELKHVDDMILGTFVVQQIADSQSNLQQLKKYIITYRKQNALSCIIQYISRSKNMNILNFAIEIAESFEMLPQIMKLFQANSAMFYQLFWKVSESNKQSQYKNFISFMINYSSIRTVIFHQSIYLIHDTHSTKHEPIIDLIKQQSRQLLLKFRTNPQHTARQCIKCYLQLSNFHIPPHKIYQSYSEPLSVMAIIRKYWQHSFHAQVINYAIWVLLDRRFAKLIISNQKSEQVRAYCRNLFLAVMHIAIGYRPGSFVIFYPTQNFRLNQLISYQGLPSLLVGCKQLSLIKWLPQIISAEIPRIVRLQNGYQLIQKMISQNIGYVEQYSLSLFNIIDHDLVNKRNHKQLLRNKQHIKRILNTLLDSKNKENAQKLIRAFQMIDHQI